MSKQHTQINQVNKTHVYKSHVKGQPRQTVARNLLGPESSRHAQLSRVVKHFSLKQEKSQLKKKLKEKEKEDPHHTHCPLFKVIASIGSTPSNQCQRKTKSRGRATKSRAAIIMTTMMIIQLLVWLTQLFHSIFPGRNTKPQIFNYCICCNFLRFTSSVGALDSCNRFACAGLQLFSYLRFSQIYFGYQIGFDGRARVSNLMEPRVGNKFRLGRKIGSGSFGEIYLGWFASLL